MSNLLQANVERFLLLSEDGSADEVLALTLHNLTDAKVNVATTGLGIELNFTFTDKPTALVAARDRGGQELPAATHNKLDEFPPQVGVEVFGEVDAKKQRTIALRVRRRNMVHVADDGGSLLLQDPLIALSLKGMPIERISYRATAIFPETPFRREMKADRARWSTSRTATWEWDVASPGENLPMLARQQRGALIGVPSRIDDAIAEVLRLRALSPIRDEWLYTNNLRELLANSELKHLLGESTVSEAVAFLQEEDALVDMPHQERDAHFLRLLERLQKARMRFLTETGHRPIETGLSVVQRAESIARDAYRLRETEGIASSFPPDSGDVLIQLLNYQAGQREDPWKWSAAVDEGELHRHLQAILKARLSIVRSEEPLSGGFLDLLVGSTPVELKVTDLKGRPADEVRSFFQQAAAYAAAKESGLGILLVLDEHQYPEGEPGPPGGREQVRTDVESTKSGVSGKPTKVVIITVVIPAKLPRPSKLKSAKAARKKTGKRGKSS